MADDQDNGAKRSNVEQFKEVSRGLRGPIGDELGEPKPDFTEESIQLLKHHGTYQQDDRDVRTERKKAGKGKDYKLMVRTKFPAGNISAEQYLVCDKLATDYGQDDMRVTSRQCFQFHGIAKGDLRPLLHDLNHLANITSLGACGDVVRNTMACPVVDIDPRYQDCGADLIEMAHQISAYFMPQTKAYFDLWVNDEKATVHEDGTVTFPSGEGAPAEEPLYGKTYLPRKFKIGLAVDFDNSPDVFTQDLGVIGVTEGGKLVGYDVTVGGGLGFTHRKAATYSRLGTHLAFVQADELIGLIEAVVKVQRDHGDRSNRKHARMKYLIDDWGIEKFREKVFERAGRTYPAPRGVIPSAQPDYLGWSKQAQPGLNYVGIWVENGRVRDFEGSYQFKTGLKRIVEQFEPDIRLTPHHNLILANIKDEDVDAVQALLDEYQIPTDKGISTLRRMEMACPALPLCGLAIAEAERFLPAVIRELEEMGHAEDPVVIRMSGCPNGCSRPRSAEIGVIGSGADRYQVYVGGDYEGTRLSELLIEKVAGGDLASVLSRLLDEWKSERRDGEAFGDWSARVGLDELRGRLEQPVG